MSDDRGTMLQYFHWYTDGDGGHWKSLRKHAARLAKAGFTAVWLPPAYKGSAGGLDTGYGVYDMYDLGEFDQKGSVRTKYGTKEEYLAAFSALKKAGLQAYADVVLNHRMGGDEVETVKATPYSRHDRLKPKGGMREIEADTAFSFPGRKGAYSGFEWHWRHFDAVDHDRRNPDDSSTIYLLEGKSFDDYVAGDYGNYDYLMGCDIDFQDEEARGELHEWGRWYLDTTGVDGFRLDAVKHIPSWFFPPWLEDMRKFSGKKLFAVGEYWSPEAGPLHEYIRQTGGAMSLFDVPLHYHFHQASREGNDYDLRGLLAGTLMKDQPSLAVTFVANHDSQALQALESVVEPWFKPLAYAFILLRREGYPCVFYPDYFGAEYDDTGKDGKKHHILMPSLSKWIDVFLSARTRHTFGNQIDYLDHPNVIGWTFHGDEAHPGALAVLLSNGADGVKAMDTGRADTAFEDRTGQVKEPVVTDSRGFGEFRCKGRSVSVWVERPGSGKS